MKLLHLHLQNGSAPLCLTSSICTSHLGFGLGWASLYNLYIIAVWQLFIQLANFGATSVKRVTTNLKGCSASALPSTTLAFKSGGMPILFTLA